MNDLPDIALSIRQPWAWAVVHGGKDIENRSWRADNPGMKFRGPFCVHAAGGMTRDEYEDAADTMAHVGVECPAPADLLRGGIIGVAVVADIVTESPSPWFFGPKGLVIADVQPVEFTGVGGNLGFFKWWRDGPRPPPIEPAKWMRTWGLIAAPPPAPEPEPLLPMESPLERMMRKAGRPLPPPPVDGN